MNKKQKSYPKSFTTDDLYSTDIHPVLKSELYNLYKYTRTDIKCPNYVIKFNKLEVLPCPHNKVGRIVKVHHYNYTLCEPHGYKTFMLCITCLSRRNVTY